MSNGIDDTLHGLRSQSTSLRNIREGKEEDIRDSDEAACGKHGYKRRNSIEAKTHPFSKLTVGCGISRVSKIKGYQQPLFVRYSSQDIHRFSMDLQLKSAEDDSEEKRR